MTIVFEDMHANGHAVISYTEVPAPLSNDRCKSEVLQLIRTLCRVLNRFTVDRVQRSVDEMG